MQFAIPCGCSPVHSFGIIIALQCSFGELSGPHYRGDLAAREGNEWVGKRVIPHEVDCKFLKILGIRKSLESFAEYVMKGKLGVMVFILAKLQMKCKLPCLRGWFCNMESRHSSAASVSRS